MYNDIQVDDHRLTICQCIKYLYTKSLVEHSGDCANVIELVFIMAKKMHKKLCEHNNIDTTGPEYTEDSWWQELQDIKKGIKT